MKRIVILGSVVAFVAAIALTNVVWGKAHVPVHKVQVCHKGETIAVGGSALDGHRGHGDCRLPQCDFNNVFLTGDACDPQDSGDGTCVLANERSDAGGVTEACPPGTF